MKPAPELSRKPWHPDTLDGIAQTLAEYGLVPAGKAPAGRSPEDGQPEELERLLERVEEAGADALVVRLSPACRGRDSEWPLMAVFVSIRRYGPPAPKTASGPSFLRGRRPYNDFHRPWECLHTWWWPWSSKPVGGLKKAPSEFDSHTLP
jgi:hypothetical protein